MDVLGSCRPRTCSAQWEHAAGGAQLDVRRKEAKAKPRPSARTCCTPPAPRRLRRSVAGHHPTATSTEQSQGPSPTRMRQGKDLDAQTTGGHGDRCSVARFPSQGKGRACLRRHSATRRRVGRAHGGTAAGAGPARAGALTGGGTFRSCFQGRGAWIRCRCHRIRAQRAQIRPPTGHSARRRPPSSPGLDEREKRRRGGR